MKVRLKPGTQQANLYPDAVYLVLGINRWLGKPPFVMLLDEDRLPIGVDITSVVTVDDRVPSSWTAVIADDGNLSIQPAEWQHPAFWNTFWGEWMPGGEELPNNLRAIFDSAVERIERELDRDS